MEISREQGCCGVAVLIVFFIRPDTLREVFESVRKARPPVLFLAQDGAREGRADDADRMRECRRIVEDVDWTCDVYRDYSDKNQNAHTRIMSAISWAFQYTDKLIYLEDDIVPTKSFFLFCTDALNRYETDNRFFGVCGGQKLERYRNYPYDCIYTQMASGCGWGLWKRTWDSVLDIHKGSWYDDKEFIETAMACLETDPVIPFRRKKIMKEAKDYYGQMRQGKVLVWHMPVLLASLFQNQLSIMSTENMITYIGVTKDAYTSGDDLRLLPRKIRRIFTAKAYDDMALPIKYPPYPIRNTRFEKEYIRRTKGNYIGIRIERVIRRLIYKGIFNRIAGRATGGAGRE